MLHPTTHHLRGLLLAACLAPLATLAQDAPRDAAPAPVPAAACEARAGAPQWLPCGPDRVLTEAEVRSLLIKEEVVTKIVITSGKSGKRYFTHFKPRGKLDSGLEGGMNVGKSWKFDGGRVCRDYYRFSEVHCGTFELQGTSLYLVDSDGVRSLVNSLEFAKP